MNNIIIFYELDLITWPFTLDSLNFRITKSHINQILKFVYNKCKYEEAEWKRDKIKFYSEQRNNDLIDNQSRMLNSVLNREKRRITLDRIMVTDQDAPYISTDSVDIERIATNHYQSSAGIPSNDVSIPNAWINEFNPQPHINASNYQDLMNPITEEEYS